MNSTNDSIPFWIRSAYGESAASLLSELGPMDIRIEQLVEKFYAALQEIPGAKKVLANLTDEELSNLRRAQGQYLASVLSPDLSADQHRKMAYEAGIRHSFVGLSTEVLTEASVLYGDIASAFVTGRSDDEQLKSIINRRFQYDLIAQIESYPSIHQNRMRAYEVIAQQKYTSHPLDFTLRTLGVLLEETDKAVVGVAIGSVKNGNYRHLLGLGNIPFDMAEQERQGYPTITSPELQEMWFKEQSMIVNSMSLSEQLPLDLRDECLHLGIRSFGMFIMNDLQGAPKGCFMVCSCYTGYFQGDTDDYWQQIANLVGANLDFIERSHTRRRHRLADGLRFRQLLAQEKVEMVYQPIVNPMTGVTEKVEALARLMDDGKLLPPGLFLSAFGTSQLRDLFDVGLKQIVRDMTEYPEINLPCSINLPPEAMIDLEWLNSLPNYLVEVGGTPDRVSLEVLESALIDEGIVRDSLFRLQKAGFSIFLDDVGAGESSLLRLVTLPVNGIKIDQAFVRTLQDNLDQLDLIISLQQIAYQRGLVCIAEGVENVDIIDMLGSMEGMLLQGYGYARPMSFEELVQWVGKGLETDKHAPFPQSLYGWYSKHLKRFLNLHNTIQSVPDLVDINELAKCEQCPLHETLEELGGDDELEAVHRQWHQGLAKYAEMVLHGDDVSPIWMLVQETTLKLRRLIEKKLAITNSAKDG